MAGKKFRFSLESVLKLRKHETEQARQALGRTLGERKDREAHVRESQQRIAGLADRAPTKGVLSPTAFRRQAAFQQDALKAYEKACQELDSVRQKERAARQHLRVRHGDEESIRTLRQQEHDEHKKAAADADAAFLDDQAISSFFRKSKKD